MISHSPPSQQSSSKSHIPNTIPITRNPSQTPHPSLTSYSTSSSLYLKSAFFLPLPCPPAHSLHRTCSTTIPTIMHSLASLRQSPRAGWPTHPTPTTPTQCAKPPHQHQAMTPPASHRRFLGYGRCYVRGAEGVIGCEYRLRTYYGACQGGEGSKDWEMGGVQW